MKNSTKITIALITLFITSLIVAMALISNDKSDSSNSILGAKDSEVMKVAICPTYQYLTDEISGYGYEVVKTNSTAESIGLLRKQEVDIVLSGRKPLVSELDLNYKIVELDDRFSFLSKDSSTVLNEELNLRTVYTDQDTEDLKRIFNIAEVKSVEDVYEYLDKGIVITSWEDSDYSKASVVHVLQSNGTRNPNSRIPVIYSQSTTVVDEFYSLFGKLKEEEVLK